MLSVLAEFEPKSRVYQSSYLLLYVQEHETPTELTVEKLPLNKKSPTVKMVRHKDLPGIHDVAHHHCLHGGIAKARSENRAKI
jgi:hypothetical protein